MSKRIVVIGAGPSGLVTVKELLDQGHRPVCFEKADGPGGVYRFHETEGVVWESCRLTSTGILTAFSDFPASAERKEFMLAQEYVEYLDDYCAAFDLERHIHYGHTVQSAKQRPDGAWDIVVSSREGVSHLEFDAVAVCSGLNQYPNIPDFPGQGSFTGQILHAAQYRRRGQVAGKKVLVIGAGESGADIIADVAGCAAETVLSLRRGVAAVSRQYLGKPRDYTVSRILHSASHWVFLTRNPRDEHKRKVYRWAFLPLVVVDKCLQIVFRTFWEYLPLFWSTRISEIRTNLKTRKLKAQLLEESGGTLNEQFGTKDDCFVRAMAAGKCRKVPRIARFDGASVVFDDGSHFEPDLVLFCTGFHIRMPFLDEEIAAAPRYLHTFNPAVGENLGFIGFLRPGFGAIPPLAELQARWFALVQSGERKLPSQEVMLESIRHWTGFRRHIFRATGERIQHLVDHTVFCDELATQVGCKPGRKDLRQQNRAFRLRFYAGPFVAAQYRLAGPHAKPELARKIIEGMPVTHPLPDLANLFLRWHLCRILHWALGPEYAPKLTIH